MIDVVHKKKISILMFEINILNYYVFIMMMMIKTSQSPNSLAIICS